MHFLLFSLLIVVLGAMPLAAQHEKEQYRRQEQREQLFQKRLPHPDLPRLSDGLVESPAHPIRYDRKHRNLPAEDTQARDVLQRLPERVRERLVRDWDLSEIKGEPADSEHRRVRRYTDEPAPSSSQTSTEPVTDGSAIQMLSSDSVVVDWIATYTSGAVVPSSDYAYAIALDGSGNVYVTGAATFADGWRYTTIKYRQITTGIAEEPELPREFVLHQNYPNPFNPSTVISWQSPVGSHTKLKIYDVLGNEVATLVDEYKQAGSYEVVFDASRLSSGVYFYRLVANSIPSGQAGSYIETKKLISLR